MAVITLELQAFKEAIDWLQVCTIVTIAKNKLRGTSQILTSRTLQSICCSTLNTHCIMNLTDG